MSFPGFVNKGELDILSKTGESHIYRDAEQNRSKVRSPLPRLTVLKKYTNEVLSVEYLVVYNKKSKFIHVTFVSLFSYVSQSKNILISQMQCYHGAMNGAIFTMKIIKKKKRKNCMRESGTFLVLDFSLVNPLSTNLKTFGKLWGSHRP